MGPDRFREPSGETRVRVQGSRDTARGDGTTGQVSPPWKIGDQLNEFVLEELLGKGSSGFVYRALDQVTERRCALKLLLHSTPEDLLRNKLGFRRMMSIEHPSLLRVDRIHQLGQYIAMSMEEVEGTTLSYAVREMRGGDLKAAYDQLLKLTRQYAAGLAVMHVNGYVHRDIKPQNLMVDRSGNGRVIDYGLVGTLDPETDPHGYRHYLAGTPRYFAPEVIWNQYYLPAGDIFGLGMVMLETLHALSLIGGDGSSTVLRSETNPQVDAQGISDAIEVLDQSVPDDLRELCLEMLQRDPGDRPTAMRVARFGDSTSTVIAWPEEKPLVGRRAEVLTVTDWLDRIYTGEVGRLHLTGPSGIGKTRLVDDVEKYIRSMRWGQVFRARCRPREDQPLQAFDQLCDAIVDRYRRVDREPLILDPVSATILHSVFPALKGILHCNMEMTPAGTPTERLDALEAAARMSHELRKVGPLILIVDDAQWADRDSLNVLDRLQNAHGEIGLGIITVSREADDPQRVPATKTLDLQPLDQNDAIEMLGDAARAWGVDANRSVLDDLAEAAAGVPFRLQELADEFRPGGALSQIGTAYEEGDSVSQLGQIDWLWQNRAARLSQDAHRVLAFVVTAGRRVSTAQLGELTGLGDAVDAAVSELVQQRLVSDEATGGECIQIVHDRVADGLVETLNPKDTRAAHCAWANLLLGEDHAERQAARIAGHFFAAGEPGRAVSFAVLAAEDAERLLAKSEAARWNEMVINHVDGAEKVTRLRHAARCYAEADLPLSASDCYRRLARHVAENERIECQLMAVTLSIRGGEFARVRQPLRELASALGIPRPKPALLSKLMLAARSATNALTGRHLTVPRLDDQSKPADCHPRTKQQLRLCLSLARPLSMFDNLYAAELNLFAMSLASKHGTATEQMRAIAGEAVFGCYDRGPARTAGEKSLRAAREVVDGLDDPRSSGDVWSATAYSDALSCRWAEVPPSVQASIKHYQQVESVSFEVAHTQWLEIWANWNLGHWDTMIRMTDGLFDDAVRRSDLFLQRMIAGGLGASAWLGRNRTGELDNLLADQKEAMAEMPVQMIHLFAWIAMTQRKIYAGDFNEAWQVWKTHEADLRRLPFGQVQLMRIVRQSLGALVATHQLAHEGSERWMRRATALTGQLRRERLPMATALANLYDGLSQKRRSNHRRDSAAAVANHYLQAARGVAAEMQLTPVRLAAEDAIAEIEEGFSLGLLRQNMRQQGIQRPKRFERLFTLPPVIDAKSSGQSGDDSSIG